MHDIESLMSFGIHLIQAVLYLIEKQEKITFLEKAVINIPHNILKLRLFHQKHETIAYPLPFQ